MILVYYNQIDFNLLYLTMDKLLPLIKLDKVYWWRSKHTRCNDKWYIFLEINGIYKPISLTQLLFDTDSGFLQSLKWKEKHWFIIEVGSWWWEIQRAYWYNYKYHSMILAQITSDEDRIKYILENTLIPN